MNDAPHDVDQPGLPFQPALVPEPAPAPVSQEPTSFEDDAAPSTGPSEPAPRSDPYAIHRAAVRGSIRGLANIRDVDFGPVADAMPIEQLREARNESDEAAETKRKWDAAVDVAIARHAAP